ncbi:MAG: hypothetical protein ACOY3E_13255 [Pseudomonadota bacterium]
MIQDNELKPKPMRSSLLASVLFVMSPACLADIALQKALQPFYGKFVQEKSGWLQSGPLDPEALQRIFTVCLDKPGLMHGAQARFVAVCGNPFDGQSGTHVDAGLIDLYILTANSEVQAKLQEFAAGSYGFAGPVELHQIGPLDHAFVVGSSYTGMGQIAAWDTVIAARDNKLLELITITTGVSNEGAGYCDNEFRKEILAQRGDSENKQGLRCLDLGYSFQFDSSSQTADYYDLSIQESGVIEGMPTTRRFQIKFDPSVWRYVLPNELVFEI